MGQKTIASKNKKAILNRLSRIEDSYAALGMLINGEEPDCQKIIQQMAAVRQ